jgi:uncharacterized membrane protein YphA (DoxX/SURF4 family)
LWDQPRRVGEAVESHFMKNMAIVGRSLAFVAFGGGTYSLARSRK